MSDAAIQFGFCVPIFACPGPNLFRTPSFPAIDPAAAMDLARQADALGYDSIWVADHLMLGKDDAILEGWTVLSAIAGATQRAKLGMIHQAVQFRNPALAAKMAATLDQISGGRLIHFMDCGYLRREYVSYGMPWDDLDARVARLAEATELTLALWSAEGRLTWDGQAFAVTDAVCRPGPLQRPHPPLWFGETTPGVLDLCARLGQGWNTTPVSIPVLRQRLALLDDACRAAGRDRSELELSLETQILVAPDHDTLRQRLAEMAELATSTTDGMPEEIRPFIDNHLDDPAFDAFLAGRTDELPTRLRETWIVGTPDEVETRLRAYMAEGITHFLLWFMDAPRPDGVHLFAADLMPRFR